MSLFCWSCWTGDQQLLSIAAWPEEKDDWLTHKVFYWLVTFNCYVSVCTDQVGNKLTSLSQSLKAEMRVKTVGFFTSLHVREETKLVTPWTYHLLSGPKQFRGPPESPWDKEKEQGLKRLTCIMLRQYILLAQGFCFLVVSHTHCILKWRLPLHISWCSSQQSPTSRCECTCCAPPRAARPAAACQA